jgi:hypothetical protein
MNKRVRTGDILEERHQCVEWRPLVGCTDRELRQGVETVVGRAQAAARAAAGRGSGSPETEMMGAGAGKAH